MLRVLVLVLAALVGMLDARAWTCTVQVMQFTERMMDAQRNAIVELKTTQVHRAL